MGDLNQMVTRMEKTEKMVTVAADPGQIQIVTKMEKTEKMVTVAADPDQTRKKERVMVRKRCLKGLIKEVVKKTKEDEKMVKVAADLNQMVVKTSRVIRAVFKVFQNNKVNFRWAMFTRHASEEKIYSELVNF